MTNNPPFPNNHSGREPQEVDPIDQMLSALSDSELGSAELLELEEFAVENDQTLDQLSAPFHSTKARLGELIDEPAPAGLREMQLATALDAMDEPEVVSLAAARATRADELKRSQKLNQRLRQLSAIAAGFIVVAGISVIALQSGIGGGDDSALESAATGEAATETTVEASSEPEADSSATETAEAMSDEAFDDAMEEADDAMEEEAGPTLSAAAPFVLNTPTPVEDLTLEELGAESGLDRDEILQRSAEQDSADPQCLEQALASGLDLDLVQRVLTVDQAGTLFEVFVLSTEDLQVFELPDCVQID